MRTFILIQIFFLANLFFISSQNNNLESPYDFSTTKMIKNTESTYTLSPYAIFGDSTQTLMTKHEKHKDHGLKIPMVENGIEIGSFELDMQTGLVTMKNKSGDITFKKQLSNEDKARFTTIDPRAEKYYSISPYVYVANNPMRYVDYRGDSISVAHIQRYDNENGTNFLQTIIDDLQSQTGFTYSTTSNGQLVFQKDSNGNGIISTTTDVNGNVIQIGSREGRDIISSAIAHPTTAYTSISTTSNSNSVVGGNRVKLNPDQIGTFIQGVTNLDNRTQGWGMTFMHEVLHSVVGGSLRDARGWGNIGAVETRMNTVRSELNTQGGNYGQRLNYEAIRLTPNGAAYMPFNSNATNIMESGITPAPVRHMQYIRIPK